MKKYSFHILLLLLLNACTHMEPSIADKKPNLTKAEVHAQKAIDACWALSEEDRASINTNKQRAGTLGSALCMEDHIVELSKKYLFSKSPDLVKETRQDLEKLRSGYGHFYWNLYNSHDGCFCGTMYHTAHNSAYARLLENMILDCYEQIEKYKLDDPD